MKQKCRPEATPYPTFDFSSSSYLSSLCRQRPFLTSGRLLSCARAGGGGRPGGGRRKEETCCCLAGRVSSNTIQTSLLSFSFSFCFVQSRKTSSLPSSERTRLRRQSWRNSRQKATAIKALTLCVPLIAICVKSAFKVSTHWQLCSEWRLQPRAKLALKTRQARPFASSRAVVVIPFVILYPRWSPSSIPA